MQSQTSKIIFAVIITAVIVGSGVYFWQNKKVFQVPTTVETKDSERLNIKSITQESASTELFELVKNTKDEFTYLVSAPKLSGDWKMIINNNFGDYILRFSLKYNYAPWGQLRYAMDDLTASGGSSANGLPGVTSYHFCAGHYYCDETERKGMGFDLTFWNAKFTGRVEDSKFYLEDGHIFLKETSEYIVTYKPFTSLPQANIDKEVENLMSTFEIY